MARTRFLLSISIVVPLLGALGMSAVAAAETITYTYDAKGRLVQVVHTGNVNNNVSSSYGYDQADNRRNVTVSGSPNNAP